MSDIVHDQEQPSRRLVVECRSDSVYVVHEPETGMRLAGRDFDQVRRAVIEGASLLDAKGPRPSGGMGQLVTDRTSRQTVLSSLPRSLVLLAPVLLGGLLLVMTLRSYTQFASVVPDSASLFHSLRLGVLKVDRALQDIEPKNKDELRTSIRSIVTSLKPFVDDVRPLFEDRARTTASPQQGAP